MKNETKITEAVRWADYATVTEDGGWEHLERRPNGWFSAHGREPGVYFCLPGGESGNAWAWNYGGKTLDEAKEAARKHAAKELEDDE